jgi:hypothetical protein
VFRVYFNIYCSTKRSAIKFVVKILEASPTLGNEILLDKILPLIEIDDKDTRHYARKAIEKILEANLDLLNETLVDKMNLLKKQDLREGAYVKPNYIESSANKVLAIMCRINPSICEILSNKGK